MARAASRISRRFKMRRCDGAHAPRYGHNVPSLRGLLAITEKLADVRRRPPAAQAETVAAVLDARIGAGGRGGVERVLVLRGLAARRQGRCLAYARGAIGPGL